MTKITIKSRRSTNNSSFNQDIFSRYRRGTDDELSNVFYQCDGCTSDACTSDAIEFHITCCEEIKKGPNFEKKGCRDPWTAKLVRILKKGCRDPWTTKLVRIFEFGCRNLLNAKSVRILKLRCRDPLTAKSSWVESGRSLGQNRRSLYQSRRSRAKADDLKAERGRSYLDFLKCESRRST